MDLQKIAPWINPWYPQNKGNLPRGEQNINNPVSSRWLSPRAWLPTSYKAVLVWQMFLTASVLYRNNFSFSLKGLISAKDSLSLALSCVLCARFIFLVKTEIEDSSWKSVHEWNLGDGKIVRLLQAGENFSIESEVSREKTRKSLQQSHNEKLLSPKEFIAHIAKCEISINSDGTVALWKPVHEWNLGDENIVRVLCSENKLVKESEVHGKKTVQLFSIKQQEGENNLSPDEVIATIAKYEASINSDGTVELWEPVLKIDNLGDGKIVRVLQAGDEFSIESNVGGKITRKLYERSPSEKSLSPSELIAKIKEYGISFNSDGTVELWNPVLKWNLGDGKMVRLLQAGDKFSIETNVGGKTTKKLYERSPNEKSLSPSEFIANIAKREASINSDGTVEFWEPVLWWNLGDGKLIRLLCLGNNFSIESNVGGKKTRESLKLSHDEKRLSPDKVIAKIGRRKASIHSIKSDGRVEFLPERETSIFSDSHPSKSISISNDRWAVTVVNTIQKENPPISDSLSINKCKEIAACVGTKAKEGCEKAVSVVVDKIQTCSDNFLVNVGKKMRACVRAKAIEGAGFIQGKIQTSAGHAAIIIEGIEDGVYRVWKAQIWGSEEEKEGKTIAGVDFHEVEEPDYLKTCDHTKTEVRERTLVERMIKQIKEEQENYEQDKPTIFFSCTGGNQLARTYNCIQWARKCLCIVDIELPRRISENFYSTPSLWTGSSTSIIAQEISASIVNSAPLFGAFWGPAGIISGVAISAIARIFKFWDLMDGINATTKKIEVSKTKS